VEFEKPLTFDVQREETQVVIRVGLPGVSPNDIHLACEHGLLRLSATRHHVGAFRFEEHFARTLPLASGVDPAKIIASYKDGALEICVPTPPSARSIKIAIRGPSEQPPQPAPGQLSSQAASGSENEPAGVTPAATLTATTAASE